MILKDELDSLLNAEGIDIRSHAGDALPDAQNDSELKKYMDEKLAPPKAEQAYDEDLGGSHINGAGGYDAADAVLLQKEAEPERRIIENSISMAGLTAAKGDAPDLNMQSRPVTQNVSIHIGGMTVREQADVDRIAEELVRKMRRTSALMPNV